MSMTDAQELLRRMAADPALAREDAAAHRRLLVDPAHEQGFAVTEQDLAEAARAAQEAPYGALDDAALEAGVGGVGVNVPPEFNYSFN